MMNRWISICVFSLGLLLMQCDHVVAQAAKLGVDPRPAKLRLETIAPASTVLKLVFSADGKRIYSAGKDKVVRTWTITEKNGRYKLLPGEKFRWEISRGVRGHIYDVDVSSQGLIAFAGSSGWNNSVDVAVYDIKTRELKKKLFTNVNRPLQIPSKVADITFSPSGKNLVAMTQNGELRIWDTQRWQEKILQPASKTTHQLRSLCFRNETEFVSTEARTATQGELFIRDLASGTSQPLNNPHFPVVHLEKTHDEGFVAAYLNGDVVLFSKQNKPALLRKSAPEEEVLKAMTLIGKRHMALSVTIDSSFKGSVIEYWDIGAKRILEKFQVSNDEFTHAMAASPDGKLLAYANGEHIRLVELEQPSAQKRIEKPFSAAPIAQVTCELRKAVRVVCRSFPGSTEIGLVMGQPNGKTLSLTFDPAESKVQNSDAVITGWRTILKSPCALTFRLKNNSSAAKYSSSNPPKDSKTSLRQNM